MHKNAAYGNKIRHNKHKNVLITANNNAKTAQTICQNDNYYKKVVDNK